MVWHLFYFEHQYSHHKEEVIQQIYDDLYQQQSLKLQIQIFIYFFEYSFYKPVSFDVGTGGALTSAPRSNKTRPTST
jgi:5-methylthioribose kinase